MRITNRSIGDCSILDLEGRLVFGSATKELREAIAEAARSMPRRIVLDLSKVTFVDSPALGQLVGSHKHIRDLGGNLVLLEPPDRVMSLLLLTRLETVFDIFRNVKEAVAGGENLQRQANA
jgi:anti-anti-sigma factor